ncbi:metallophosphoesterase [Pseudenhygromyxa sp. WMMC2535]|uniref:metallophosphoesterase n=1 Tax=Pseudenhygromyxa sp. WMMC2535 TaxID=2712867 RepID=UPI0015580457|nr:metallophosphoesterase [Pseudenhygromyxa sp. WMMC2535]NVB41926.1 metallophosphoesterase [Pseudenhygromyxa sp. WMMC2535]
MHDLVIVSDFHLGRGKNAFTGRYHELEAFFYDEDFRAFCQWLIDDATKRNASLRFIINGDAFDMLRIDRPPQTPEATMVERQFGPFMTPDRAARDMADILDGHPGFVDGLARLLVAGHEVVILPGNHDIEIQWAPVRRQIEKYVLGRVRERATAEREVADAGDRLRFPPWFWYEPGRIWIEHGCQYDPENAFTYQLRGALAEAPREVHESEYDMPLGNFFQRYLFNGFGAITFIVPSTRAHTRYAKWLLSNTPHLIWRVLISHLRFWPQAIRRIAQNQSRARAAYREAHKRALDELAELPTAGALGDKLREVDALKERGASVVEAVSTLTRQVLTALLGIVALAALVFGLWFAGFHAIAQLKGGFMVKAMLFMALDFTFLVAAIFGIGWGLFRSPRQNSSPLRRAAQKIVNILDVPVVAFGHTHDEVLWRLERPGGQPAWYYNTGTWLAVFTHDVLMPRERVQFTFLRMRENEAELLYWSPGRQAAAPVILLDERNPQAEPRRQGGVQPR